MSQYISSAMGDHVTYELGRTNQVPLQIGVHAVQHLPLCPNHENCVIQALPDLPNNFMRRVRLQYNKSGKEIRTSVGSSSYTALSISFIDSSLLSRAHETDLFFISVPLS